MDDILIACFANANSEFGIGYPKGLEIELYQSRSVTEFFKVMAKYPTHWNWINTQVMEKIASLSDQTIKLVEHYKAFVYNKKLIDVLDSVNLRTDSDADFKIDDDFYSKVKEKWNKPLDEITIKDIKDHKSHVGEIFGINKSVLVLARIAKGCVEVEWLIPKKLAGYIYEEFCSHQQTLSNFDIVSVKFTLGDLSMTMKQPLPGNDCYIL